MPSPILDQEAIDNLRALDPDGGDTFLREIIGIFIEDTPKRIAEIDQSLAAGDVPTFVRAAHTIKGSASAIGAWRLARFAEMAEQVDVEADVALSEGYRDDAVAALATAIDEVCRFIARLLANP